MFGAGVVRPLRGAGPLPAALGGDDETLGIGMERFGDELFRSAGAVGVCGVNEVDAELDGAAQSGERSGLVSRRTPDAFAGDAHSAVAEAMNGKIAAEMECACGGCGDCAHELLR